MVRTIAEGVQILPKIFDQLRRLLLDRLAEAAGMTTNVLKAYKTYLEAFLLYNVLAGGRGQQGGPDQSCRNDAL